MKTNDDSWEVITSGALAAEIRQCLTTIAAAPALQNAPAASQDDSDAWSSGESRLVDLARGAAGRELFRLYWSARDTRKDQARPRLNALHWLSQTIATETLEPGLYLGITGLMWLSTHMLRLGAIKSNSYLSALDEFDVAVAEAIDAWEVVDVVRGLCGFGIYAFERMPQEGASRCLESIVARLARLARWERRGAWWPTPPAWIHEIDRARYPEGWCDLGMAHGCGGVIAFLARVLECIPRHKAAARLLEGAVDFILAVAGEFGNGTHLPTKMAIQDGAIVRHRGVTTRPRWCYGSLGVACAVSRAAAMLKNEAWMAAALSMVRAHVMWIPSSDPRDQDPGLCHGMAGVAHMLNRLYQRTGAQELKDAAIVWYRRLLRSRNPASSPASVTGFRTRIQHDWDHGEWTVSYAFLTGIAGIGLALLSACEPIPPSWDRLLLI